MTTTTTRVDTDRPPAAATTGLTARAAYDRLLTTLRAALHTVAELDPDALGSRTPAGRAAVPLAGTARAAVAALGGDPGTALAHAPGVVVGRDLAAATTLLTTVPPAATSPSARSVLADLAAAADRRLAELRAVTQGR